MHINEKNNYLFAQHFANNRLNFGQKRNNPSHTCALQGVTRFKGVTRLNNLLETTAPFTSTCDHCTIQFTCILLNSKSRKKSSNRNFFKADNTSIQNDLLNVNWLMLAQKNQDVESFWQSICEVLNLSISSHVALLCSKKNHVQPLAIRKLASKKRILYRHYKRSHNISVLAKYKCCSRLYDAEIIRNCIAREKDSVKKANLMQFYSYVKSKTTCINSVPPLVRTDGSLCIDDCEKSILLNNFFASVFVSDNGTTPVLDLPPHENSLNNVLFSYDSVVSALQKLPS